MRHSFSRATVSRATVSLLVAGAVLSLLGTPVSAGSLQWFSNYEAAKKEAVLESKPMLVMFTASWCGPCQRMKSGTLSDKAVETVIDDHFIPVMIDVDANRAVTRKFGVTAMPTIMVIHPVTEGAQKTRGYQGKAEFLSFLNSQKQDLQLASATAKLETPTAPAKLETAAAPLPGVLTPYCLVTIVEDGKLEAGQPEWTVTYEGLSVSFASAEKKARFEKTPSAFWPELQGDCPVTLKDKGEHVRGEARWAVEYDENLYLCHSRELAQQFLANPTRYAVGEVKVSTSAPSKTPSIVQ